MVRPCCEVEMVDITGLLLGGGREGRGGRGEGRGREGRGRRGEWRGGEGRGVEWRERTKGKSGRREGEGRGGEGRRGEGASQWYEYIL